MASAELTVIAPCFNEELNIEPLCARVLAVFDALPIQAELLLVDDGSFDRTWERISEAAAKHARVRAVRHETNRGIVAGWLSGLGNTTASLVCLIDSDLQNRPEDIPRLYRTYLERRPDLVHAVRHPKVNRNRIVFSKVLNAILNLAFGMHLRDNKSGFILCRREVLEDILKDAAGYRYFQSFVGVAAGVRGYGIEEVDTAFDGRSAGESFLSKFPLGVSLRIVLELGRYRAQTLRRGRR